MAGLFIFISKEMDFQPWLPQWFQDPQLVPISLVFFVSLIFLFCVLRRDKSSSIKLPPSPPKLPIIGNLHHLGASLHRSLHALSQKYGPLMLLYMGRNPTIIVSSAEMAKEIMKTHDSIFADRPTSKVSLALFGCRDVAFANYGEYWRQARKICTLDLLSMKRVRSYKFIRDQEMTEMVKQLTEASVNGKLVDLSKVMLTVSNNIITRITLGRKLDGVGKASELAVLTKEVLYLLAAFSVEDLFPPLGWIDKVTGLDKKIKRTSSKFHEFLDEVIQQHMDRRNGEGGADDTKDLVDILLDCQRDVSLGVPISRGDLRSIIMGMFVAGTSTTYSVLKLAFAELIKHPRMMMKLQEEIRKVVGKKQMVDENDVVQMIYLNCVIKEALRLMTTMLVPRVSTESVQIGPYFIPAKTKVFINTWSISRDLKAWDTPEKFYPERFIDNPIDFKGTDFDFIPFGAGRRRCPGIAFGMASVESILANLLHWFDWEMPSGANKEDLTGMAFGLEQSLRLIPVSHPFA